MSDIFKILSDRDHALQNPDMYIGSVSTEVHEVLVDGVFKQVAYVPGMVKIANEIIDNCIDEAIRTDFKFANLVEVTIEDNTVSVKDNGRGIPQDMVETPDGEKIPRPVAAWTRARAGSNFNADRKGIGKNGVGSSLANFFSDRFIGITCDGKNTVTVHCTNNADHMSYQTKKGGKQGTSVMFTPDFEKFGVYMLDENFEEVIRARLVTLAVNFPDIAFKFNGKKIDSKFKTFAAGFGPHVADSADNYGLIIAHADDYKELSFVNGVHTKQGGTHTYGVLDSISDELIAMVKRKHKVEITKARIKESIFLGLFIRNLTAPKFDSQTKERLSSSWAQVRDHMGIDYKAIARKIMNTPEIIDPVIANALARKEAADKAAATKAQKKALGKNVAKHVKANGLGKLPCTLFLTEGDSAIGYFIKVRDENTQGGFPLRGKILNTWNKSEGDALKNAEIQNIVNIMGVPLGSTDEPLYRNIAIMTDQDVDGKGSIGPLVLGFIYKFWSHWYEQGRVYVVRTPEYISTNGKQTKWCYSDEEFRAAKFTGKWEHRHIKGLGSLTEEEYKKCVREPVMEKIILDDNAKMLFNMLLNDENPSLRKEWLGYDGDIMTGEE